jgi:hypothetical protein
LDPSEGGNAVGVPGVDAEDVAEGGDEGLAVEDGRVIDLPCHLGHGVGTERAEVVQALEDEIRDEPDGRTVGPGIGTHG